MRTTRSSPFSLINFNLSDSRRSAPGSESGGVGAGQTGRAGKMKPGFPRTEKWVAPLTRDHPFSRVWIYVTLLHQRHFVDFLEFLSGMDRLCREPVEVDSGRRLPVLFVGG